MYYVVLSQIENAFTDLPSVAPDFKFMQSSASLEEVCHCPVGAEI